MTLEESILHYKQTAEWLEELKQLREKFKLISDCEKKYSRNHAAVMMESVRLKNEFDSEADYEKYLEARKKRFEGIPL